MLHGQLCLGTLVLQDAASVRVGDRRAACAGLGVFARFLADDPSPAPSGCMDACAGLAAAACPTLACAFEEDPVAGGGVAVSILVLFGKLVAAMLLCFLLERFVLRRAFAMFARSLELLYLGALGYATGLAALAVTAGFSGEITAFLAGVSISQLPYKMHIETKMEPIKSLGVAVFFISLGLQLELGQEMVDALPLGVGLAVFTLFATLPLFAALGFLAGLKSHTVFMLGLLMNQISEFSLILCTLCVRAGVFEPVVLTVMTVAAVASIVVSSIGHAYIDAIYRRMQRWACLRCLDARRAQKLLGAPRKERDSERHSERHSERSATANLEAAATWQTSETGGEGGGPAAPAPIPLLHRRPTGPGTVEDWAFEDQLKQRNAERLEIDRRETEAELAAAREAMAATVDEKAQNLDASARTLYGRRTSAPPSPGGARPGAASKKKAPLIRTSHASDIRHGMIEGYVVVDRRLVFCTLRAGRMLFWEHQHDVGHAPPASVWDVSGMAVLAAGADGRGADAAGIGRTESSASLDTTVHAEAAGGAPPWEWTLVLGHIHRHTGTSSLEDDAMKLVLHGLEDHSDHDAQDWRDALAVATSTLNPIALRLAHIREELHNRRHVAGGAPLSPGFESRADSHQHRNEIICIGYNEMFPAVLALADAIGKEVVVVEYDPMKLNTIEKLYSEEQRLRDFRDKKKKGKNPFMATVRESFTTDDIGARGDLEQGAARRPRPRRVRMMSTPVLQSGGGGRPDFWAAPSKSEESHGDGGEGNVKGVKCEYADIHDPECWEELEMDQAFMLVCTIKGARHAEKAMLRWLRRQGSDAIFVACTQNNVEAMGMYKAGAHFVMQTDALAMRSTREIFLETVANVGGDCSQLVAAGLAHKQRLAKLQTEDSLKFQYETG